MNARKRGISGYTPAQQFFSFVDEDAQRDLTTTWEISMLRSEHLAAQRVKKGRKRIERKVYEARTLDIDWQKYRQVLDSPLLAHEASDLDVQPDTDEDEAHVLTVIGPEVVQAETDQTEASFLDDDSINAYRTVAAYHEAVLTYSLNVLKTRGNAKEKYEILQWIWSGDIYCWVTKEVAGVHKQIPILRRHIPFTFQMCCAMVPCSSDDLREKLAREIGPLIKQLGLESLIS